MVLLWEFMHKEKICLSNRPLRESKHKDKICLSNRWSCHDNPGTKRKYVWVRDGPVMRIQAHREILF